MYKKVSVTGLHGNISFSETSNENLEQISRVKTNFEIDWGRCQKCMKPCKILLNHVKKSKKCQEKYDMELLERESKKRSMELKKSQTC